MSRGLPARGREHARIDRIRELLAASRPDIRLGIGDDAAVLAPSDSAQVLSVDVAVDGVHFRRAWATLAEIGARAFVAAISDLAAMGARPRAALSSLVLPPAFTDDELLSLVRGIAEAATEVGAPVVGGNLARGAELSITTTVVGEAQGRVLEREGARPGDHVWVTGSVGAAALGLALLEAGRATEEAALPFVARWRRPTAQLQIGQRLLDVATAAIDVSDGVVADLGHLCVASGVGARIEASALPLAPGHEALARSLGADPLTLALAGGEDYELLFTAPASTLAAELATPIGRVEAGDGVVVLSADGSQLELARRGFSHF